MVKQSNIKTKEQTLTNN